MKAFCVLVGTGAFLLKGVLMLIPLHVRLTF
jgi:hypothetical protein